MDQTSFDIQEGMEVFGNDGIKIGKVSHIFSGAPLGMGVGNEGIGSDVGSDATSSYGTSSIANTFGSPGASGEFGSGNSGAGDVAPNRVETGSAATMAGSTDSGFAGGFTSGSPGGPVERFGSAGVASRSENGSAGSATLTPSDTKYFEVHYGGLLGIGGEHLYVPFSAVEACNPGESITVRCSSGEATHLFDQKPDGLDSPGK